MHTIPRSVMLNGKKVDLTVHDMKLPAHFESDNLALKAQLIEQDGHMNPKSGRWEKDKESGVWIRFSGGKFVCHNFALYKLIVESPSFRNGTIRVDPEDPSGWWRKTGVIKAEERQVFHSVVQKEIDVSKIDPKKIDDEKLAPLARSAG